MLKEYFQANYIRFKTVHVHFSHVINVLQFEKNIHTIKNTYDFAKNLITFHKNYFVRKSNQICNIYEKNFS